MSNFCVFLEKQPLTVKFSKFCPKSFHRLTDQRSCVQIREICPTRNRALFIGQKKFPCISNCRYCVYRAQSLPPPAPNNVLKSVQISCKSVHFRRIPRRIDDGSAQHQDQTVEEHRQIAVYSEFNIWSKPSFEPNNKPSTLAVLE